MIDEAQDARINQKANAADLSEVATSGSYNDLSNKPTIPSLSGYATEAWVTNKGYQTAAQVQTAISGKADKSALDAHTGNTTIHVTAADKTAWNGKQDAISDLATIRNGAAAGATAIQPGSLATVATSGSYNDLSNKPTIPTVPTDEISANTAARHTHSNKSLLDTYTQTEGNLADAVSKKHTHSNKTVLDGIITAKLLPAVTSSGNDKFLRVVSGAWAAATVPSAESEAF